MAIKRIECFWGARNHSLIQSLHEIRVSKVYWNTRYLLGQTNRSVWPSDTFQMSLHAAGTTVWNRICTLCSYRYFYYYRYHYIEVAETSRNKSDFWMRVCSIPIPSLSWATLLFGYQQLYVTDSYCGVCIWPWNWFALGNTDLLYVTRCIPVKNTLDWSGSHFVRVR